MTRKPSVQFRKAVSSYLDTWRRRETHGLQARIMQPLPLYRFSSSRETSDAVPFADVGWRCFLKSGSGEVHTLDAIAQPNGDYAFRLYTGGTPLHWRRVLRNITRRHRARQADYEPRIASVPAIHLSFVWFYSGATNDCFAPLDGFGGAETPHWMTQSEIATLIADKLSDAARQSAELNARVRSNQPRR